MQCMIDTMMKHKLKQENLFVDEQQRF